MPFLLLLHQLSGAKPITVGQTLENNVVFSLDSAIKGLILSHPPLNKQGQCFRAKKHASPSEIQFYNHLPQLGSYSKLELSEFDIFCSSSRYRAILCQACTHIDLEQED